MNQPSDKKHKAPLSVPPGYDVREVMTGGHKTRYQAVGKSEVGPLRLSRNSATADAIRMSGGQP